MKIRLNTVAFLISILFSNIQYSQKKKELLKNNKKRIVNKALLNIYR